MKGNEEKKKPERESKVSRTKSLIEQKKKIDGEKKRNKNTHTTLNEMNNQTKTHTYQSQPKRE